MSGGDWGAIGGGSAQAPELAECVWNNGASDWSQHENHSGSLVGPGRHCPVRVRDPTRFEPSLLEINGVL